MSNEKPTTAKEILQAGVRHMEARSGTYDSQGGERSMGRAVAMFNACHDTDLTVEQGWHLMELVKHVRFFSAPGYHGDSVEDGAAYAALRGEYRAAAVAGASDLSRGRVRFVCGDCGAVEPNHLPDCQAFN